MLASLFPHLDAPRRMLSRNIRRCDPSPELVDNVPDLIFLPRTLHFNYMVSRANRIKASFQQTAAFLEHLCERLVAVR